MSSTIIWLKDWNGNPLTSESDFFDQGKKDIKSDFLFFHYHGFYPDPNTYSEDIKLSHAGGECPPRNGKYRFFIQSDKLMEFSGNYYIDGYSFV